MLHHYRRRDLNPYLPRLARLAGRWSILPRFESKVATRGSGMRGGAGTKGPETRDGAGRGGRGEDGAERVEGGAEGEALSSAGYC